MTDATGTTTYGYDANGDVTSQALVAAAAPACPTAPPPTATTRTGVRIVTYPSYSGHTSPQVTYTYDGTGAMANETDWLGNEVPSPTTAMAITTAQDNDVSTSTHGHQLNHLLLRRRRREHRGQSPP